MLARNSGHIVAISSAAALSVASNIAPYTASKAGVSGKYITTKTYFILQLRSTGRS